MEDVLKSLPAFQDRSCKQLQACPALATPSKKKKKETKNQKEINSK